MVTGVIYRYISPSGKSYIGQTTNEVFRRRMWFGDGRYTGGRSKIDMARKKYGRENFRYEVIHRQQFFTLEEATTELNRLEAYYIGYYDTYKNGYNSTIGGDGSRGYKADDITRAKLSVARKGKKKPEGFGEKISKAQKGRPKSTETRRRLSETKKNTGKKIVQYDLEGNYIRTWNNIDEVSKALGVCRESIAGCCRGKSKSAHKSIWRYSISGIPEVVSAKSRRKDSRHILQLTLNGEILREFPSIQDAANFVGVASTNLSACCRQKVNSIKGYKWRYKDV